MSSMRSRRISPSVSGPSSTVGMLSAANASSSSSPIWQSSPPPIRSEERAYTHRADQSGERKGNIPDSCAAEARTGCSHQS
eukprot:3753211-Pyramimonas_sp.AAC.1